MGKRLSYRRISVLLCLIFWLLSSCTTDGTPAINVTLKNENQSEITASYNNDETLNTTASTIYNHRPFILFHSLNVTGLYCPRQCRCEFSLEVFFSRDVDARDIKCDINDPGFHLNREIEGPLLSMRTFSYLARSVRIQCHNNTNILWTDASFVSFIHRLEIIGCGISVQNKTVIFPETAAIKVLILIFPNTIEDVLEQFIFRGLKNLITLHLEGGKLLKIPSSMTGVNLHNLTHLILRNNSLESIECSVIRKWNELRELDVSHNLLKTIPRCWFEKYGHVAGALVNRNKIQGALIAHNNRISDIDSFGEFNGSVLVVDVSFNNVTRLPSLKTDMSLLNLSHNFITELKREHFDYYRNAIHVLLRGNLTYLDISHNLLHYIEDGTFYGISLYMHHLDFSNNFLTRYEAGQAVSGIVYGKVFIDVSNNKLLYPPFHATDFKTLTGGRVYASGNPYICDCNLVEKVEKLHLCPPKYTPLHQYPANQYQIGIPEHIYYTDQGKRCFRYPIILRDKECLSYLFRNADAILRKIISDSLIYSTNAYLNDNVCYDADKMKCAEPSLVGGKFIKDVNVTEECNVVKQCPSNCLCTTFYTVETTTITCDNLTMVPSTLPVGNLELDLSGNNISTLRSQDYFDRVIVLYLNNSNLNAIEENVFTNLKNIRAIDLSDNNLSQLPLSLKEGLPKHLEMLRIHGNKWNCSCDQAWMQPWLKQHKGVIESSDSLTCSAPLELRQRKIMEVIFDCDIMPDHTALIISVSASCALVLLFAALVIYYRNIIKVLLYTNFKLRPFDQDEIVADDNATCDAFIAYSTEDGKWVRDVLVPMLEEPNDAGYKTIIHERDFEPGGSVIGNIEHAVETSRRTILVLSRYFLQSQYCRYEFQTAHAAFLENNSKRLILMMLEDLGDTELLDGDLQSYLRTNTYLSVQDRWFKQKLYYAMPSRKKAKAAAHVPVVDDIEVDVIELNEV